MPRMRSWADVAFYRPDNAVRYQHIDALFSREIDWALITKHWPDMMQVALSIQVGRVLPSMLLRKLGTYSRKNRLSRAFRELGRVERTLFLLRFISNADIRQSIYAETTKIESYNDFLDWVSFGGPVIKSGDPVEQDKQLKYASLVANTIMLSNVTDLTAVLSSMAADGIPVTPDLVARLKPLHARTRPPLRPVRPRHERPTGAAQSNAPSLRSALVTYFCTYLGRTRSTRLWSSTGRDGMPARAWSFPTTSPSCLCRPIRPSTTRLSESGSFCAKNSCPCWSFPIRTPSSMPAATLGMLSSPKPVASKPSATTRGYRKSFHR
jgi:hypothetical protein